MNELAKIKFNHQTLHIIERANADYSFVVCYNAQLDANGKYSWDWGVYCKTYEEAVGLIYSRLAVYAGLKSPAFMITLEDLQEKAIELIGREMSDSELLTAEKCLCNGLCSTLDDVYGAIFEDMVVTHD